MKQKLLPEEVSRIYVQVQIPSLHLALQTVRHDRALQTQRHDDDRSVMQDDFRSVMQLEVSSVLYTSWMQQRTVVVASSQKQIKHMD